MRVSRSSSDDRYRIDYISESCQAVWGLSRAQIGDNLRQLWTRIHPDDVSHLNDRLRAAERGNHEWTATFRIRGSVNGREKWAVARGLPRPDLPGDAWNITVTDITAQIQAYADLQASEARSAPLRRTSPARSSATGCASTAPTRSST